MFEVVLDHGRGPGQPAQNAKTNRLDWLLEASILHVPLVMSALNGQQDMIALLIDAKADPNARGSFEFAHDSYVSRALLDVSYFYCQLATFLISLCSTEN